MEDICTPKKKLIHPKFGLNYLEYSVKVILCWIDQDQADGLPLEEYSPKVNYFMSIALSRMSSLFVIHPIDVTIIDVSGDNNSTTMLIHHLVDSYNRTDLINVINNYFNDGSFNALMASLDSDFSYVLFLLSFTLMRQIDFSLVRDTFRWSSFNIFYNPYFDMLLGVLIVSLIWYGLCKLGRKCGEKKRKEKEAAEKLLP